MQIIIALFTRAERKNLFIYIVHQRVVITRFWFPVSGRPVLSEGSHRAGGGASSADYRESRSHRLFRRWDGCGAGNTPAADGSSRTILSAER